MQLKEIVITFNYLHQIFITMKRSLMPFSRFPVICAGLSLLLIFICMEVNAQAGHSTWTAQQSASWFRQGNWNKGMKIKPHPSINQKEFAVQYHADPSLWKEVFAFLNRNDLADLAPGKYPLAGDSAYAIISGFAPKSFDQTQWESHRKYIDVQYVISGKEKIGVAPVKTATVTDPYDPAKDAAHYKVEGKYYTATPKEFFIFFPQEAHRPDVGIKGQPGMIKKLVIKVMVME